MDSQLVSYQDSLERDMPALASVLTSQIDPKTFLAVAANAMVKSPDLATANQESVIVALTQCAKDGLMPDGKEAALIVFNKKVKVRGMPDQWLPHAQYMPMVDGVLKRARMSGEILSIAAKVVNEGDVFEYWVDESGEHLNHRPDLMRDGSVKPTLKLVYAYARLTNGETLIEIMNLHDINRVKGASKTSGYGPWVDWFDRMACKSALHRLARRLPSASELMHMLEVGNQMKFDKEQQPEDTVEKDISEKVIELYPDALFEQNFPKWESAIEKGKKTPQQIIDMVNTKGALTNEQVDQINGVAA